MTGTGPAAQDRRRAVVAGHRGDHDTLRRLSGHPDGTVRAAVLAGLHRSGGLTPADLHRAVADRDPAVRRLAAELGPAPSPLLDDPEPLVVEAACAAAGEDGGGAAVATLVGLADGHDDPRVREAAVAALGAIGDEGGRAAVLAATRDKAPIRRRAVLALAAFDGPDVDAALARARDDRDWQTRQAAEDLS